MNAGQHIDDRQMETLPVEPEAFPTESEDEEDADNEGKEGVQCAHSLDG